MRRAFTLIEIIVVIGILGLLIALLLPMLVGAKEKSGEVVSLANLHSIGQMLANYGAEYNDECPYYSPNEPIHMDPVHGGLGSFVPVWLFRMNWPISQKIYDVAPWEENYESWLSPGVVPGEVAPWLVQDGERLVFRPPSYQYSNNFIGKNAVWTDDPPPWDEAAQPRTFADVRFTSLKVIMWDDERAYLRPAPTQDDPTPVLFVDGAASLRLDADATPPADNPHFGNEHIYNDTPAGLAGRDFQ